MDSIGETAENWLLWWNFFWMADVLTIESEKSITTRLTV
jgi:hypothetical protein